MKREIKFRAWNEESKKMMSWEDIKSFNNLQKLLTLNHVIVMQFTGLCDKHGMEIYEGDIVEFVGGTTHVLHCGNGSYPHESYQVGKRLAVQALGSGFTLRPLNEYGKNDIPNTTGNVRQYEFWNHQESLKIIGNVFENPELLNTPNQ